MMEMDWYFEDLRKAIEPDLKRKREAQKADDPVREHLETHWSFSSHHLATFLYGSYRRSTAIGDIKDVDVIVVTKYTIYDDPVGVLETLKSSLGYLYERADLADQRRSIRIDRPLPDVPGSKLTLDIVPAIYSAGTDDPIWIPDRDKARWVRSHPKRHLQYARDLNARSYQERAFVRLAKMMKCWWKYQFELGRPGAAAHTRKPKGFWVEVMTGEYADLSKQSYPQLIVALLENALDGFGRFRTDGQVPTLRDPGLRGERIKTSMTDQEFAFFRETMEESLQWAREALHASSEEKALDYWRRFFGDEKALAKARDAGSGLLNPAATVGGLSFPDRPVTSRNPAGFA